MTAPPATPPAWPLGTPTAPEAALWADVWSRPAASLWERYGLIRDAATYVRTVLAFETGGHTNAALGGLMARQADNLGLTVAGAARNRWSWPTGTGRTSNSDGATVTNIRPSSRERFRRVPMDPTTHSTVPTAKDPV